jgi:hypothetical protein
MKNRTFTIVEIPSPRQKKMKYGILLEFFKNALTLFPDVCSELKEFYKTNISDNKDEIIKYGDYYKILNMNPIDLFMDISIEDMY